MTDIFTRAEEWDEVHGGTCLVGEGEMEGDALQELLWECEEWGGRGEHGRRRGREGSGRGSRGSIKVYMEMTLI